MHRIHVTWHASNRFAQRIDAVADPIFAIMEMWEHGRVATLDDFGVFRSKPFPNHTYRVGAHNGTKALLAMKDNTIVTVICHR